MRLSCLQFSPQLGKVKENMARVDTLLETVAPQSLDILVLPELAFSGYNFLSFQAISPYLELTAAGPSTQWAITTAARLKCIVTVGYPELASPQNLTTSSSKAIAYNSTITISPNGRILAHYRKTHLFYTDETWASESPTGWLTLPLDLPQRTLTTSFGICMDLNPYAFTAPYSTYEFATHASNSRAQLILLSMAWLTNIPSSHLTSEREKPDLHTLEYWLERLRPLLQDTGREVMVVFANRSGEEGEARYAGTSWIGSVGKSKVQIWGMLGRAEEGLLVGDTDVEYKWEVKMNTDGEEYEE